MGEIVKRNAIEREAGYLYYVTAEGHIGRAKLQRGGKKKNIDKERERDKKKKKNIIGMLRGKK